MKAASLSDSRMSGGRQDRRCTLQHIKDEQLGQGAPAYIQVGPPYLTLPSFNMSLIKPAKS